MLVILGPKTRLMLGIRLCELRAFARIRPAELSPELIDLFCVDVWAKVENGCLISAVIGRLLMSTIETPLVVITARTFFPSPTTSGSNTDAVVAGIWTR